MSKITNVIEELLVIMDFSNFSTENEANSEFRNRWDLFIAHLRNNRRDKKNLIVNIRTKNGSRLAKMQVLQIMGDTLYLTDAFESMAIIDFSHIQVIELVD
jgi:hypothetical protein